MLQGTAMQLVVPLSNMYPVGHSFTMTTVDWSTTYATMSLSGGTDCSSLLAPWLASHRKFLQNSVAAVLFSSSR